ncbi:MAG: trypsin-like peptidase domain-containing protein, partial [Candidatus Omnitrophica bacterium]|nr:trypsin-like peptidase domain-containing protein [Candidatus Omnitrophota bacterium]
MFLFFLALSPVFGSSKVTDVIDSVPKEDNTIYPNECRNGALENSDATFSEDGTHYDRYTLAWPGGDLEITLASNDFDAYLIITTAPGDPDGQTMNVDNFFTDPETYTQNNAPAGTYTIWANSAEISLGNYQVCVNQAAPCEGPTNPTLSAPSDQANDQPLNVTLNWSAKRFDKVIYGDDDRTDLYEVTDQNLLRIAESTVMLVPMSKITNNGDGTYTLASDTFNDYIQGQFGRPLCPSEPFANQPNPGDCSGFLVGPDLVVTAGHCIGSENECSSYAFVFGFQMIDANTPKLIIPQEDVYTCGQLVGHVLTDTTDWTIVRLDRAVANRKPLDIRRDGEISVGADLVMIGNPEGLPTKVAGGASVRSNNSDNDFFVANLDSFEGNSGAVVVNAQTLTVEGALVRGDMD